MIETVEVSRQTTIRSRELFGRMSLGTTVRVANFAARLTCEYTDHNRGSADLAMEALKLMSGTGSESLPTPYTEWRQQRGAIEGIIYEKSTARIFNEALSHSVFFGTENDFFNSGFALTVVERFRDEIYPGRPLLNG